MILRKETWKRENKPTQKTRIFFLLGEIRKNANAIANAPGPKKQSSPEQQESRGGEAKGTRLHSSEGKKPADRESKNDQNPRKRGQRIKNDLKKGGTRNKREEVKRKKKNIPYKPLLRV